jgi:hypothetical protein
MKKTAKLILLAGALGIALASAPVRATPPVCTAGCPPSSPCTCPPGTLRAGRSTICGTWRTFCSP